MPQSEKYIAPRDPRSLPLTERKLHSNSGEYKTEDVSKRPTLRLTRENFIGISEISNLPPVILFFKVPISDASEYQSFALCYQEPINQTDYLEIPSNLSIYQIDGEESVLIKGLDVFNSNSYIGSKTTIDSQLVTKNKFGTAIVNLANSTPASTASTPPVEHYPGRVEIGFGRQDIVPDNSLNDDMISRVNHITFTFELDVRGNVQIVTATDRSLNGTIILFTESISLDSTQPIPPVG